MLLWLRTGRREMGSLLITNGTVVTMDDRLEIFEGAVYVEDGRVAALGDVGPLEQACPVIDAAGAFVLPGFVQTHVHLCQTLFRGMADDLSLMDWLKNRIWPLEAAHDEASLRASARLAALELLLGGTTTVLTMETVHDTDVVFEAVAGTGLRAIIGKCMMDAEESAPPRLRETRRRAIDEALGLAKRWRGAAGGRLGAALAPRFAVSCSPELLAEVASLSESHGLLVHTHAAESREEVELVRRRTGRGNIGHLEAMGLLTSRLCVAHCVWVDEAERAALAASRSKVLHCPGSNLKLGSGLAPVVELRKAGVCVSLGADGGACNNRLDMFDEMRLAALIQAARLGPGHLTARDIVRMATLEGARALGLEEETGSIAAGKRADLIVVDRRLPHAAPTHDVYSHLVYAARGSDVRATIVDGDVVVENGEHSVLDRSQVLADAQTASVAVATRAGLAGAVVAGANRFGTSGGRA
jgi:5-methylthioadenosine/S-adenosylhomocysteine deaminase